MAERQATERVEIGISYHPRDVIPSCGYTIDTATREQCGADPVYVFTLLERDSKGSACATHAQVVRTWPDLERMWAL